MITQKNLEDAGYKKCVTTHKGSFCTSLWQTWEWCSNNKLYALNFYFWEFPGHDPQVSVEVRMYTENEEFDLNLFVGDKTLEEVEAFYANAYHRLGGVPDKHNN